MKISGFSFVRNGTLYDYPFLESIQSILPICDELVVAVGNSSDDTLARIRGLNDSKIKIVETVWNESLRSGGTVLSQQTDIALKNANGDWAFYLQADEVIHEKELPIIRHSMEQYLDEQAVEGLVLNYNHFYGSYRYVGDSRRWYRREIRVIRNGIGVQSWGDAQGFRIGSRKLHVKPVDASIYHYGWVKPPHIQQRKQQNFNRLWHSDEWIANHVSNTAEFDYSNGRRLRLFTGTHPQLMRKRVEAEDWTFIYDPYKLRQSPQEVALDWIEKKSGYRLGEYKNYTIL